MQGDQVYIFKSDAHHTLIEGYPKSIKEELSIEGPIDAAFLCDGQDTVHIIKGKSVGYAVSSHIGQLFILDVYYFQEVIFTTLIFWPRREL